MRRNVLDGEEQSPAWRDKLLLRPVECADILSLSRSRVYELIASGVLPSIAIGRSKRVSVQALLAWVRAQQTNASSGAGE